jgi:hypothetical protein
VKKAFINTIHRIASFSKKWIEYSILLYKGSK